LLRPARAHFHPPATLRARTCLAGTSTTWSVLLCFIGLTEGGFVPRGARSSPPSSFAGGLGPATRLPPRPLRLRLQLGRDCGVAAPARALARRSFLAVSGRRAGTQAPAVPGVGGCGRKRPRRAACGAVRAVGLSACRARRGAQAPLRAVHAPRSAQAPPAQRGPSAAVRASVLAARRGLMAGRSSRALIRKRKAPRRPSVRAGGWGRVAAHGAFALAFFCRCCFVVFARRRVFRFALRCARFPVGVLVGSGFFCFLFFRVRRLRVRRGCGCSRCHRSVAVARVCRRVVCRAARRFARHFRRPFRRVRARGCGVRRAALLVSVGRVPRWCRAFFLFLFLWRGFRLLGLACFCGGLRRAVFRRAPVRSGGSVRLGLFVAGRLWRFGLVWVFAARFAFPVLIVAPSSAAWARRLRRRTAPALQQKTRLKLLTLWELKEPFFVCKRAGAQGRPPHLPDEFPST